MQRLFWIIAISANLWAQEVEKLQSHAGVTVGKVTYRLSETKTDAKVEAAIVKAMEPPSGEEVRYFYNRVDLTPSGGQVIVMLISPYFVGSGGASAMILQPDKNGYRVVSRHTLVTGPIVIGPGSSRGWKNLTWLVRGGGEKAHYATLHFDGKSYPSNPSTTTPTAQGTVLQGPALLANPIHPESGLRFVPK